jgi:hypothetical protein
MACRITDDVVNALQHCRLKAFFQLRGEAGAQCGYEKLLVEQRANARHNAIERSGANIAKPKWRPTLDCR